MSYIAQQQSWTNPTVELVQHEAAQQGGIKAQQGAFKRAAGTTKAQQGASKRSREHQKRSRERISMTQHNRGQHTAEQQGASEHSTA